MFALKKVKHWSIVVYWDGLWELGQENETGFENKLSTVELKDIKWLNHHVISYTERLQKNPNRKPLLATCEPEDMTVCV